MPAPRRRRRCEWTAKVCFTEEEARRWLADYRRRKHPRARRMRAYRCDLCGTWHLTKRRTYKPKKRGHWI